MTDCPNADVRDLLPDLLHGRLDAGTRARVEAHVSTCAECAAELSVLRSLRDTMHDVPAMDTAAIVAAIPSHARPRHRSWVSWRIAATITVLLGGASSLLVLRNGADRYVDTARVTPAAVAVTRAPATGAPAVDVAAPRSPAVESTSRMQPPAITSRTVVPAASRELAMGVSMSDLSDRELTALLKAIDELDAVPSTEVVSGSLAPAITRRATP